MKPGDKVTAKGYEWRVDKVFEPSGQLMLSRTGSAGRNVLLVRRHEVKPVVG